MCDLFGFSELLEIGNERDDFAIGRDFGSGTFGFSAASAADADNARASARLVAHTVDRKAAARQDGVTTLLRGESFGRSSSRSI